MTKKLKLTISIVELLLGIYGIWWLLNGFLLLRHDGWGLLYFYIAIPFLLVGIIGYKNLRGKSVRSSLILLFLGWMLCGTISGLLRHDSLSSLIETYKNNFYAFVASYIIPIVLILDLLSKKLLANSSEPEKRKNSAKFGGHVPD